MKGRGFVGFFRQRVSDAEVVGEPVTCENTVISPQVMVCTGGRRNNLLQEVQCPVIHRLPGPSDSRPRG